MPETVNVGMGAFMGDGQNLTNLDICGECSTVAQRLQYGVAVVSHPYAETLPMTDQTDDDPMDLDFTKVFAPETVVAEPVSTPKQEAALSEEAVIGESRLTSNGYFVRLNDAAPRRKPKNAPPTVLVVEDDEVTATLISRILSANRYAVRNAGNREGILAGLKTSPDLVILDVMMPDANGFDILNRIRQHPALKDMPVLMLTSLGALDDILKGLKLGANGYLTKPAKSKALLDAIKGVLA
jgi:CheY-like chemotaxis protein